MSAPHGDGHGQGLIPGLVKGLATTARNLLTPAHTAEYPDVPPILPPRSRGVIALLAENCTSCMLCARECPDWCIYIDAHKETVPAATPSSSNELKAVMPGRVTVQRIERASHALIAEQPAAVSEAITAWIRGLPAVPVAR